MDTRAHQGMSWCKICPVFQGTPVEEVFPAELEELLASDLVPLLCNQGNENLQTLHTHTIGKGCRKREIRAIENCHTEGTQGSGSMRMEDPALCSQMGHGTTLSPCFDFPEMVGSPRIVGRNEPLLP